MFRLKVRFLSFEQNRSCEGESSVFGTVVVLCFIESVHFQTKVHIDDNKINNPIY